MFEMFPKAQRWPPQMSRFVQKPNIFSFQSLKDKTTENTFTFRAKYKIII